MRDFRTNGSRKKIYEKACKIYSVFDNGRNFIADQEIIGYAENIRKIKKLGDNVVIKLS